ncbi:MAG: hypothetical protein EOO09_12460 [Chitinophagaceae bacterium]|nr:MAG: hypothetical protein EOO09_12460 [Chitinophagaceae bacterium]
MKFLSLKSLIVIAVTMFTVASCSKKSEDAPPPPADPIIGTWVGTYRATNSPLVHDFVLAIKPAGILEILGASDQVVATGTWKLDAGVFYGIYEYKNSNNVFNVAAKFDSEAGTLNGSYGDGKENPSDGDFEVVKQ